MVNESSSSPTAETDKSPSSGRKGNILERQGSKLEENGDVKLDARKQMLRTVSQKSMNPELHHDRSLEWVDINDDVYNMFFLSQLGGQAFWYGIYIFILKLTLYVFLARDALDLPIPENPSTQVLVTQFFMLPVAVAMQDDLIATYYLVANIKYHERVQTNSPHASNIKFHVANLCRGIDGMFSLLVNFVILIKATEVLSLFLNFAALQFLQTIDNIALRLCADGYLTERLEFVANQVMTTQLPNKNNEWLRSLDSVLFVSTLTALLIGWGVVNFGSQ
mmetsp:Transcript_24872/g.57136  ORF Transcript_24872/g.57136 Transcript_24872/m.57136 type:complete len:278 (-) Transcript_24872:262-1095(-)